jgi:hypothetical protein
MASPSRLTALLLLLVGLGPAGCAWHFNLIDPAPDPGDGIRVPRESEFASMVRSPGETVSLTGNPVTVVGGVSPPPATGPVDPPAKAVETPSVDPSKPTGDDFWPPRPIAPGDPFLVAAKAAWDGRPDRVADALRPLDKAAQEAVRPLLLAAAGLALSDSAATPRDLAAFDAQIGAARAALQRRMELRVENARFVKSIEGYRWYEPLPENYTFRASEFMVLYAEVTPLAVDALKGGGTGIDVSYTVRVSDSKGQPVYLVDKSRQRQPVLVMGEKVDRSQGNLIEKHIAIGFGGPQLPGTYRMELEVRDVHTGRVAKQSLEFRVGGR